MMNQKTKVQIDEDQRGYLGIQGVDVPTEYVQRFGMPEGAMVTKITEGSPASDAGLQLNDIITAVDGQKVSSFETLRSCLLYTSHSISFWNTQSMIQAIWDELHFHRIFLQ